jgi:uncharacterized RDD family membrane protein YckC
MKTLSFQLLAKLLLSLALLGTSWLHAEDKAATTTPEAPAPAVQAPAATPSTQTTPVSSVEDDEDNTPDAALADKTTEQKSKDTAEAPKAEKKKNRTIKIEAKIGDDEDPAETKDPNHELTEEQRKTAQDMVTPGGDVVVSKDTIAKDAVAILGDVLVEGRVLKDAVSVLGDLTVKGPVSHDAVAVLGDLNIEAPIGHDAVAVLGDVRVNAPINHELVCVLGDIHLGPNAKIGKGTVCVLGDVIKEEGAVTGTLEHSVRPPFIPQAGGLTDWVRLCLIKARLLAFSGDLGWAWAVAAIHLALYVLLGLLMRRPMEACVDTLHNSPGMSLVSAICAFFLSLLVMPLLIIVLSVTVIGIPLLIIGLVFAQFFTRGVCIAWLGSLFPRIAGRRLHLALEVLLGGLLLCLLYCVPVVGFLIHFLIGFVGTGAVCYTLLQRYNRRASKSTPPTPPSLPAASPTSPLSAEVPPLEHQAAAATTATPTARDCVPPEAAPAVQPPPTDFVPPAMASLAALPPPPLTATPAATLPRATFSQRMGALAIDLLLVGILFASVSFLHFGTSFLVAMAAYGACLWKLRGATVGGIICKLEVVRLDGRPIDWSTSIVRALGTLLSAIPLGLGFFWIAMDRDSEAWHDKIAGTAVVRTPSSRPLV